MVAPYATPAQVKMYARIIRNDLTDNEINAYTLNEDRMRIDVALANGMGVDVPLSNPPEAVKVLSAKCSALAILKALYGSTIPSDLNYKELKAEVEKYIVNVEAGEVLI